MKKYIKSTSGNLVYEIERQNFTETFRTPENYFQHATRAAWFSVNAGFNVFVQYKGAFYMIDRTDAHDYITSLEFSPVTAEEAAAAKMERAAQAMSEAQEHEAKTAAAALDYDTETAEAEAREARFSAGYAAALAKDAAELAERAEIIAAIKDDQQHHYIEPEATAHQWTPDETRATIEYRATIRSANRAALALLDAYAAATGEYPAEDDDETHAAYLVARDDLTGTSQRATEYDRETVELMTEAIARAAHSARPADIAQYAAMRYLVWSRAEVVAYVGDPDAYDVDAILQDMETSGASLAEAAERHELYSYAPAI